MRPIEFSMASLEDIDLASICKWSVEHSQKRSWDALSSWFVDFLGGEALRRTTGEGEPLHYIVVPFDQWSDADVADGLLGVTVLSYAEPVGEAAAKLIDKLVVHIVGEARRRLKERHVARCN